MAAFENPTTVAVLDAIVDALESMGIPVDQFHPESAPGQFEIVTAYGDALAAVDNLIKTRIVIKEVSKKVGNYVATFAPKVYAAQAGTASHVHLSLWSLDGTKNLFLNDEDLDDAKHHATSIQDDNNDPLPKVSHLGKWFLAGVLKHLPALMAITTPTPMSFERIQPCFWSGAYQVWGIENREAPLRVSQDGAHFEIKTLDGTANPYLALGAIICAGLDGIRNKEQLPPPCQVDPGALTQEERDAAGILRLPEVLEDALEKLRENKVLAEGMGPELFENFLAVRTKEAAAIAAMNPEDVRKIMIDRY
ncbi:hypothetical protein BDR26DRAFT_849280 [Obelidium mucronatum]|nr:hypothetical protein BDR26DRAFT_849280 [Obelidium mucronatum]